MPYYLIVALQGLCIYHAIKNHKEYYWFFVIVFLPIIGSLIYIITQVLNKSDINKLNENVTLTFNPTKKIRDFERKLEFAETYKNRVDLADAYLENKNLDQAIFHYKKALEDYGDHDTYILENLINALHQFGAHDEVVNYSQRLKSSIAFKGSKTQFIYGLSLSELRRFEEAEENIRTIDVRYSNYPERLFLAKFLKEQGKINECIEIVEEIFQESKYMNKNNKRQYRATIAEVEKMREELHVPS